MNKYDVRIRCVGSMRELQVPRDSAVRTEDSLLRTR